MVTALNHSEIPPSRETFEGSMMLRLASGSAEPADVVDAYRALATELSPAQFREFFPGSEPLAADQVDAALARVVDVHRRTITRHSPDALAVMAALVEASRRGLVVEFGDAVDDDDAIVLAHQIHAAEAEDDVADRTWGYVYADAQDLDEMVLDGRLSLGYGVFDDKDDDEGDGARDEDDAGRALVELLTAEGLPARLDEESHEVVVEPLVFETVLPA